MAGLARVEALIKQYPNFPKAVFPIFSDPIAVEIILNEFFQYVVKKHENIDVVVALESRGFLFGPSLALRLNARFVPVRKAGKLPCAVVTETYTKEYGQDAFQIPSESIKSGDNVLIVDDLLATGGSLKTAVRKLGGDVKDCLCLIGLPELHGEDNVGANCHTLLKFPAGC